MKNPDGSLNLMTWECAIPGKKGVSVSRTFRSNLVLLDDSVYETFDLMYVFDLNNICHSNNGTLMFSDTMGRWFI